MRRLHSVARHLCPAASSPREAGVELGLLSSVHLSRDPSVWTGEELSADPASWRYSRQWR
jgi:hypothetical protein